MFRKLFKKKKNKKAAEKICKKITFLAEDITLASDYNELKNCCVIGNTRFMILESKKIFFASNIIAGYSLEALLQKWVLCEEDFGNCEYDVKSGKISFLISGSKKFLTGNTISTTHYEPNNLYHFLIDCLFDALMARDKGLKIDNIIINYDLIERFRNILHDLFPNAQLTPAETGEIITVENLITFGDRNSQWHWLREKEEDGRKAFEGKGFINHQYIEKLHDYLVKSLDIKPVTPENRSSKKIVFIIRKSSFRNTLNQEALCQFLAHKCQNHELQIIDPLTVSFKEMGEILSAADLVFCQAGSALTNIIFANKKGLRVVTWRYFDKNQDTLFQEIIESLDHKYLELPGLLCQSKMVDESRFSAHLASESLGDLLAPIHLIDELLTEFFSSDNNKKI